MAARLRVAGLFTLLMVIAPANAQTAQLLRFGPHEAPTRPAMPGDDRPVARYPPAYPADPVPGCGGSTTAPSRLLSPIIAARRSSLWPVVHEAECRASLPAGLMDSVVLAESGYDSHATSRTGAAGLSQLMPATALQMGVLDRFDPAANIRGGAYYLRSLLDQFGGDIPLALAAYNAGPGIVRRVGRIPANGETPAYVDRVMRLWRAPGSSGLQVAVSARGLAEMLGFAPSPTP